MSDVTILRAERWVDVDRRRGALPGGDRRGREPDRRREPPGAPQPGHRGRPGRRDAAARAHGHGAQHAHRRPRRPRRAARPDARGEGLARLPDPARRRELQHDAVGRLHHRAEPRPHGLHGGLPARRGPGPGRRPGVVPRPAHLPGRPRHHPDRRPPRPHDVPGARPRDHAPERGVGHRQRGGGGAQVGALPDEVRGQAHQDLGVRWRDVLQLGGRGAAVLRRGAGGHRGRGAPQRAARRRPRPRRLRDPGLHPGRRRLHRARVTRHRRHHQADGRLRDVPRRHHRPGRPHGHRPHPPDPAEEGGRDLPPGPAHVRQGPRRRGRRSPAARMRRPSRTGPRPTSSSPWSTAA